MAGTPIVQLIDGLVAAEKELGGSPQWVEHGQRGEFRMVAPLLVDGRNTGADLEVNAYPNIDELRFRIMLRRTRCFARVDYVTDEGHVNLPGLGPDFPKGLFYKPHVHHWGDNRQFSTRFQLPETLPIVRLLPDNLRRFDATLRWFCGEYNIAQPPAGLVDLPARTRLL